MASRSFHTQKNRAEMYVRELIETDEPSDLSSRTDALATYKVDPLSSHRATKKTKKKSNKTMNVCQCEDSHSLASTSSEEETQIEAPKGDADPAGSSVCKRGARQRSRSRQFNNTLKRATQTDRHRIKLLSVLEEADLVRKYEVTSARDWLGYGPYSVSIGKTPSCTCEDFMKSRSVKICKHLIWVYVVVLGVDENSDILQQAALTEEEVGSIFQHAPPPCTQPKAASSKNRLVPQSSSSASSAQCNAVRIIRRDPRNKEQPV